MRSKSQILSKLRADGHITDEEYKMLEQEQCDDAISRQAVQDYIAKYLSQYLYNDVREAVEVIDEYIGELPSVKPQEPKTGNWIWNNSLFNSWTCSECGLDNDKETDYCPNCGAKMADPEKSEVQE